MKERVCCIDYAMTSQPSFAAVAEVLKKIELDIPTPLVVVGTGIGIEAGLLEFLKQHGLSVRLVTLNEFDQISQQEGVTILRF